MWAFKHELPSVAEEGLQVTYEFLQKLIEGKREVRGAYVVITREWFRAGQSVPSE